jgi:hypothetical protein
MTGRNCYDCHSDCERAGHDGRPLEGDCYDGDALDEMEPAVAVPHLCTDCPVRREVVRLWDTVSLIYAALFPESDVRPETTDWA